MDDRTFLTSQKLDFSAQRRRHKVGNDWSVALLAPFGPSAHVLADRISQLPGFQVSNPKGSKPETLSLD